MNKLLLKPSKYLSSFREGYADISLLIPFLNPISSIAAIEYTVGLDEVMGPEETGAGKILNQVGPHHCWEYSSGVKG